MDFDLSWLLVALPVAFALGWMASRLDLRQLRQEHRDAPRAYFKGLNLLLNEQQDRAIDAFIEAVQHDPDTAELHFALGNLFRRRGEFERAVRVHEHLLARADLKAEDRDRARYALAQDFLRAGLFDRAEAAFRQLERTAFEGESLLALLSLYERSRDWPAAIEVAQRLEASGRGAFSDRIAHYQCERAETARAAGRLDEAQALLEEACRAAPTAARPLIVTGHLRLQRGDTPGALEAWETLMEAQPASAVLVASDYAAAARQAGREAVARKRLLALYAQVPSTALLRAVGAVESDQGEGAQALDRLLAHLQAHPSLSAAQALLEEPHARWGEAGLAGLRRAVDRAAAPLQRYRCAACGFEARHYFWQCPGCLGWGSYPPQPVEEA
jgi:lipopolysaccharide biosynthesis regulator YciM